MSKKPIFPAIALALISLFVWLGMAVSTQAGLSVQEAPLQPSGIAFEINSDNQGFLWISDNVAGEIWQVAVADGSYTIYPVGGGPTDARSDGAGNLWWADSTSGLVGRLDTSDGTASTWEIPGFGGLYGTALDGAGGLWVTDSGLPYLYHLSPAASEVCTYTLPLDGFSNYPIATDGIVWLGDRENSQILRLETASQTFTGWQLPIGSRPMGLALDGAGGVWWTNPDQKQMAHLVTAANQIFTYTQAAILGPQMLTLADGKVWYSDQDRVGVLDPTITAGKSATIDPVTYPGTPKCAQIADPVSTPVTTTSGQVSWNDAIYATVSSSAGWQVFQLPEGASGWGIAATEENIWLVDQGRQVLAKLPKETETKIYLPLLVRR